MGLHRPMRAVSLNRLQRYVYGHMAFLQPYVYGHMAFLQPYV